MKMYLSSYRLGNEPQKLAKLFGGNKKIAVITNALDYSTDLERRKAGVKREMDDLISIGLSPEEIDLRDYFGKHKELEKELSSVGGVWVRGGNTFLLRRAYKNSGMDYWLLKQKENREFVYAGYSAGVCVLSPSLKGIEILDDPITVGDGYQKEAIWEGLGLIDFAFAPHFDSPGHPETELVNKEIEYYEKEGVKYKALRDGEVIIIN